MDSKQVDELGSAYEIGQNQRGDKNTAEDKKQRITVVRSIFWPEKRHRQQFTVIFVNQVNKTFVKMLRKYC